VSAPPDPLSRADNTADVVNHVVVSVSDRRSLATVVSAIGELAASTGIRVLDMVVVTTDADGLVGVIEVTRSKASPGLIVRRRLWSPSQPTDIENVSLALKRDAAGNVLVTED
jgi:hypothetical protein